MSCSDVAVDCCCLSPNIVFVAQYTSPTLFGFQPREKQVEIDQLQYELGAVRRRTDTEVSSLRQRVADLELQVNEARREADEYYRASVEHNTEATALANQVIMFSFVRYHVQFLIHPTSLLQPRYSSLGQYLRQILRPSDGVRVVKMLM